MKKIKIIILISMMVFFVNENFGQKLPYYYRRDINVDSLIKSSPNGIVFGREVIIYPKRIFASKKEEKNYQKLERNFIKVYPVVLEISKTYRNIDDSLARFDNDAKRNKYLKMREKQIMDYYRPRLVKFTLSQSILIVKLLDRETGSTAFEIVSDLKGSVKAFFWQNFAKMFGNDLKNSYDAQVKDKEIEYLVKRYKEGSLY